MNKFSSSTHERIYFEKLEYLLFSKSFNDITFNCKDGKTSGNRLVLSIYSNFLTDIFKRNPLLVEHPLYSPPDSGISLPEIHCRDMDCLLQVLNTSNYFEMSKDLLNGLYHVAKQLKIELVVSKLSSSVVRVQAVPKETTPGGMVTNKTSVTLTSDNSGYGFSNAISAGNGGGGGSHGISDQREAQDEEEEDEDGNGQDEVLGDNGFGIVSESALAIGMSESLEEDIDEDQPSGFASGLKTELLSEDNMEQSTEEEHSNAFGKVCPVCKITCKTATGLKIHIGHAHRDSETSNGSEDNNGDQEKRKPMCKCGKIFSLSARKLFREHREKCIAYRRAAFICEICESPFLSMPSLSIHLTAIHGVSKEQRQCLCGATFGSSYSYRKHAVACEAYKRAAIFCEFCNLPFLTSGHLTQHLQSSHRNQISKKALCDQL